MLHCCFNGSAFLKLRQLFANLTNAQASTSKSNSFFSYRAAHLISAKTEFLHAFSVALKETQQRP